MLDAPTKLVFDLIWLDPDLQEILITASSAHFSGQVNLYVEPQQIEEFARKIEGFPLNAADRRELSLGQSNISGYGTATFVFQCYRGNGQAVVRVELRMIPDSPEEIAESAVVLLSAVASDIDRFVRELRHFRLYGAEGATATLRNSPT